ncbi:gfo/Idh/MocA family oxidoreductase [Virgibacillus dakarensis]|uniref:Virulence factor MviM n=1 Tax=Lentibacillus populi TaxID=1827502 RepID=A0A9W5U1Z7_9BACI|nr:MULTISPECIES: Gfo/Idh/MocA family oxidoreductase [Bacillaceae]MBT2217655.1 Gfo/Idh/MocA family oxidoreductase [Virgibacillus dakarensis]MTW86700.1 gfo/Idh/MocA family oxidoreductase [Virgibacillus dakarensis]GGB60518.1 virulence factor MviM [Lentibacillus populi]
MKKPRIGMIGLGGIAQKAYLPVLTKETDWIFAGAFSPSVKKRQHICKQYRIQEFASLTALTQHCDAVFVHSSTASHYDVVSELLNKGKDVYVDKPLAATVSEAEKLVNLSEKNGRRLMVGFNRRFAPMYVEAKEKCNDLAWVRFEKHRISGIGIDSYSYTMLDDYIHLIDTVRWLADENLQVLYNNIHLNNKNQLIYAQHTYETSHKVAFHTAMHRNAGINLEQLELFCEEKTIRVKNMQTMEVEQNDMRVVKQPSSWETILKLRGFEGAIGSFIDCVHNDVRPVVDGEEGLKSQIAMENLLNR